MLNYSWKASPKTPNRWGRPEFNASFSIGFGNGLHAGSVQVVKAAVYYAHDCGFEAGALHELSFMFFLFMAK